MENIVHPLVQFAEKTFDATYTKLTTDEENTLKENLAIYQFGTLAVFVSFMMWISWMSLGLINKVLTQVVLIDGNHVDVLGWLHRFN